MTAKRPPMISIQMYEGVWYRLDSPDVTECCDCSLIHITEYMFENGRMFWKSRTDKRATKLKREQNGIILSKRKAV